MTDGTLRNVMAILLVIVLLFSYVIGYLSGVYGWWWTGFAIIIFFPLAHKILK
ncbi:MAG: hypothetical protein HN726_00035 [Candidatus Magasanikbacteria bacterium]|nr:hypothetical protein [Candidatus Magasanikbacteria bacterium]MBT4221031.1 hypothetical protein [Candidatus Magasanikbacteria bacterium]MBT4350625.1 hypothetical protein [Candidatus Magasanikbacteria bacterium]MBT4542076.1 hypothetical protein [Candidatus Magasanikbacteria bacterium]MBT6253564.1 hypothetical protein [Candidatus Magasanikbacteria bacterium]